MSVSKEEKVILCASEAKRKPSFFVILSGERDLSGLKADMVKEYSFNYHGKKAFQLTYIADDVYVLTFSIFNIEATKHIINRIITSVAEKHGTIIKHTVLMSTTDVGELSRTIAETITMD